MTKKKFIFIGILLVVVIVVFVAGLHPILLVNGVSVSTRTLRSQENLVRTSYANLQQKLGTATSTEITNREIDLMLFNQFIEVILTHETLVKEIAPDTLSYLLGEKLKRVDTDASLRDAAQSLYSAPFEEIRAMIFVPQAERDILTSRLFLEGKTFETWLTDAKRQAHVYILKPGFVWDGETVKAK